MVDRVPLKVVLDGGGQPEKLSQFQAGDTIGITHGGTGADNAADARTNLDVPSNADLTNLLATITAGAPATLDTFGEIAAAIGNNPNLSTEVVYVAQIIDALTSTLTDQPLSANQGRILNNLITALTADVALRQLLSEKGQPNGYAGLDATGVVPAAQLPGFVDDVLEFANLAAFPAVGDSGKMYVALDTGQIYRWSGTAYVAISTSPVDSVNGFTGVVNLLTTNIPEGTNLYYTDARVAAYLDKHVVASNTIIVNTTTGFQDYFNVDFNLLHTAQYLVTVSFIWAYDATNSDIEIDLLVNGTEEWQAQMEPKDSAGGNVDGAGTNQAYAGSGRALVNLTPGNNAFQVGFRATAAGVEASIRRAVLTVERYL